MTLRLPPVAAGSPFAHRAPDITAVRLLVCAAEQSQAESLLAHLGQDALMALLTEATEGDGYVDLKHSPVRYTLNLQKRTETSIERFGLVGQLFGLPGRDLAFVVERVQPDPDPTKDAGDVLTVEVAEATMQAAKYIPEEDWVRRQLTALEEAGHLPLVLAGQAFANHERQWLAWQAEQDARPYEVETEGVICSKCENLQPSGAKCSVCGATNGDRAAGALIVLNRRGGFKEGDRVVIRPSQGAEREGALLRSEGGGRRWLIRLRDEGMLGPGTLRPQPITAVVEVQQRTLNGFANGDISLRRVAALLIAPDEVLPPGNGELQPIDDRLNPSQQHAVRSAVNLFPGSMQLVQGPPGTGKTTSIVETVRQLVARDPSVRILMTSHANTAVDNAQERLQGLDSLRMVRIAEPEKVDPKFRASIVEADDPRVRNAHVVFGTVNRIALACKEAEMFDWLILDEANKVRFTETLPLLRLAPRWLLVGDHRQLPPVLDESAAAFPVEDDDARAMVRDASFFELSWSVIPETNLIMLDEQYRMAAPIGSYVSVASYDGRLRNSPEMAALRSPLPWPFNRNLTWLTIRGREKKSGSGSLSNRAEIEAVGRVVRHLQRLGLEHLRVAVIAMYQDQVTQLKRELRMVALPGLAVDTVDAFEGEEADVVILSLVRSNEAERIGFLKKAQRLNVAISRAKQLLVVVGDIETMTGREGQDLYRPLLEHIEREGRVAGIGAVHAMDQAVGGRRRGDRRRQRPGTPAGGRRRRRGFGPRPVPAGATPAGNGTEPPEGQAPAPENGAVPVPPARKFRRRRGRRRGYGGANGAQAQGASESAAGSEPGSGSDPRRAVEREPAVQAAERNS
ncbi:MAG TPA: AAA domain-containing protein [Candidatus Dormibacteraeota bacterium]|nr:AAA domain-containing protein [Candidatus Dormibacteraeota bacterium]